MLAFVHTILILHPLIWNVAAICTKNYNTVSNTLSYQDYYDGGCSSIEYRIGLPDPTNIIKLVWKSFYVKGKMPTCDDDKIEVFTGCSTRVKVATLCSDNLYNKPHPIYSKDGCMFLVFNRTNSLSTFKASYTAHSANQRLGPSCSYREEINLPSGTILSPNWPYMQTAVSSCTWVIKVDKEYILQVNVMDLQLGYTSRCIQISGDESKPHYFFDENVCESAYSMSSRSLNTKNYEVSIKYHLWNNDYKNRGFVVGWLTYKNPKYDAPKDDKEKEDYNYPPGVKIVIPVVVVVIVVAITFARQRQRRALSRRRQQQQQQAHTEFIGNVNGGLFRQQQEEQQQQQPYDNNNTGNWNMGKRNAGMENDAQTSSAFYIPPPMYSGPAQGISEPPPSYSSLMEHPPPIPPPQTPLPQQYDQRMPYPPLANPPSMPYPPLANPPLANSPLANPPSMPYPPLAGQRQITPVEENDHHLRSTAPT